MLSKHWRWFIGLPRSFSSKTSSSNSSSNGLKTVTSNKISRDILANTKLTRNHLTPEIALRLITPECKIFSDPFSEDERVFETDPFWGFYWPGGQAISRYILDNPEIVKFKTVLDVGCGSGACSIAATMCGARYALANDIDEVATVAAQINAKINNTKISTCWNNLIGTSRPEDIILIGDLFYDSEFAAKIVPWLQNLRRNGKEVLIGDPGRHGLSLEVYKLLERLATFNLPKNCCIENNGFSQVHVWKLI